MHHHSIFSRNKNLYLITEQLAQVVSANMASTLRKWLFPHYFKWLSLTLHIALIILILFIEITFSYKKYGFKIN